MIMRIAALSLLLSASLIAAPALADWTLDIKRSHLNFITVKAKDKTEIHTFIKFSGTIADDGTAEVKLELDSVETLIPVRNERMREFLFETTEYKDAALTAKIDPAAITGMAVGDIAEITAEGQLALHGATQPMTMLMQVAKVADNTVMVASAKPLIVDANKFGLDSGVEKLREMAGLDSISHAVPVTFVLTFVQN